MTTDTASERPARASALPPDERRAAIVAAAVPLVKRLGAGVTTRQIAEAAGIAEGTIFRVFDTKDDVIDAVVADVMDLGQTVTRLDQISPNAELHDAVRQCAVILADRLRGVIDVMIAVYRGRPHPDDHGTHRGRPAWRNEQHARSQAALAAVLSRYRDQLRFTPERAAQLLWMLVFGGTHHMMNDGNPLTPTEITDVLLSGIVRYVPAYDRLTHHEDVEC